MKPLVVVVSVLVWGVAGAQSLLSSAEAGEPVRLLPSDASVLDLQETRNDLPCSVNASRPELGFDFLFQAGYQIRVPLKELAGESNSLTILLRVLPEKSKDRPVYFVQKFHVPAIAEDPGGDAVLDGAFRLGEGKYHVDLLMRDMSERLCAQFWDTEAKVNGKDISLARGLVHDVIQPSEATPFYEEAPLERQPIDRALNIKVIINFTPPSLEGVTIQPKDLQGLVAILRKIERDPRIGSLSIVACSMQTQQIIYRQQNATDIDLPALGRALETLNLGKVDAKQLAAKNGESEFFGLITDETREEHPGGLIFVSPKYSLDANVSPEIIAHMRTLDHPVFYLNYSPDPFSYPWRDGIGSVVKQLHGFEYPISHPRDLFTAWPDIVTRLFNAKHAAGSLKAEH
jgi:hypothetical protein